MVDFDYMPTSNRQNALILCDKLLWKNIAVEAISARTLQCFAPRETSNLMEIQSSVPTIDYVFWIQDGIQSEYTDFLDMLFDHWPDAEHVILFVQSASSDLQIHPRDTLLAKVAHCYIPSVKELREAIDQTLQQFFPDLKTETTPAPTSTLTYKPSFRAHLANSTKFPVNPPYRKGHKEQLIVVASSTGGVQALSDLLSYWPKELTVPTVVAHHLPARFQSSLIDILQRVSDRKVILAENACKLDNAIYISPFDFHTRVFRKNGELWVEPFQGPKEHFLRPAADPLFRSAGELSDISVVGVVLTGMGKDGMAGAQEIHSKGGSILCQDEDSSVVWGMPKRVYELGITEGAFHPNSLGRKIQEVFDRNTRK